MTVCYVVSLRKNELAIQKQLEFDFKTPPEWVQYWSNYISIFSSIQYVDITFFFHHEGNTFFLT